MRNIEYRAWDKDESKFLTKSDVSCFSVEDNTIAIFGIINSLGECGCFGDIEFNQSIGMLDKNGTKIFEGDIVGIYSIVAKTRTKGVVFYSEKVCAFMVDDKIFEQYVPLTHNDTIEIVGNKYDNKEMLNA